MGVNTDGVTAINEGTGDVEIKAKRFVGDESFGEAGIIVGHSGTVDDNAGKFQWNDNSIAKTDGEAVFSQWKR
jgi:hypothetical protein